MKEELHKIREGNTVRKPEFLESYGCKDVIYYIMYEEDKAVGI